MIIPTRPIMSTVARAMLMGLACAALAGCFEPSTGADVLEPGTQPPGALFGADAGANSSCSNPDPSPLSLLHVRVRTTPFGGRYAPRNVGAIWIEDAHGTFVKTLERWGSTRARYLTRFNAASGGNVVDAVTSATLSQHVTHNREWDLTDKTKCEIPTGDYRVVIEHTDYNGTGASIALPFTKDQTPATLTPAETTMFHDLLIELR
jgi:hypothetical protein